MKHSTRTTTGKRPRRTALAIAAVGTLAASLGVVGNAQASSDSQTNARPARQLIVWLDDLLHPIDIADIFVVYGAVNSRVGSGDGGSGLSACTGETRMRDVVGADANVFYGVFNGRDGADGPTRKSFTMSQHVADQATNAQASKTYATIVKQISACQDEPAGHWSYGPTHSFTSDVGTVKWMTTRDGDGTLDGGVAIAIAGHHLSVLEIVGAGTPQQLEGVAGATLAQVR